MRLKKYIQELDLTQTNSSKIEKQLIYPISFLTYSIISCTPENKKKNFNDSHKFFLSFLKIHFFFHKEFGETTCVTGTHHDRKKRKFNLIVIN